MRVDNQQAWAAGNLNEVGLKITGLLAADGWAGGLVEDIQLEEIPLRLARICRSVLNSYAAGGGAFQNHPIRGIAEGNTGGAARPAAIDLPGMVGPIYVLEQALLVEGFPAFQEIIWARKDEQLGTAIGWEFTDLLWGRRGRDRRGER